MIIARALACDPDRQLFFLKNKTAPINEATKMRETASKGNVKSWRRRFQRMGSGRKIDAG